mgnify:CR=1 FL=1
MVGVFWYFAYFCLYMQPHGSGSQGSDFVRVKSFMFAVGVFDILHVFAYKCNRTDRVAILKNRNCDVTYRAKWDFLLPAPPW